MLSSDYAVRRGERVCKRPRVSVIVPSYHAQPGPMVGWLDEALDSVRAQTFSDWELIVVDDGSPVPVAPARRDDLVMVRQANTGPGGARNRGAQLARGEFVAYLDADDRFKPEKLAAQVAFLDARPKMVFAGTDMVLIGGAPLRRLRAREKIGERIPFTQLFYENCVGCSTVMVRRAALEKTPGMHPHRRMGEDFGLWLRLGMLGPIGHVARPLLERRQHGGSLMFEHLRSGRSAEEEQLVYEEFLAEHPELRAKPFVRAAMARLEFERGWTLLVRRQWAQARRALMRSLWLDPTRPKAWIDLARAVLHVGSLHGDLPQEG